MKLSKSQRRWFIGALCCIALALIAALLMDALLAQWRPVANISRMGLATTLSERSLENLTDTSGTVSIACILPSESPSAFPVGRLLRAFALASEAQGGATLDIAYVDPRVETTRAAQLIAQGAEGPGVLVRKAGRHVFVPEGALQDTKGNYDPAEAESVIAAAIARLSRTDGVVIGWLTGHGEQMPEATDPSSGFSGLRRMLEEEGFQVRNLTLSAPQNPLTDDLGAVVIMGPRYPITSPERAKLADWLDRGGRLLVALPPTGDAGLGGLLEQWGVRTGIQAREPIHLTDGHAGLTKELSEEHPVTRELAGKTQLTFGAPRSLISERTPRGVEVTPLVSLEVAPLSSGGPTNETISVMVAAARGTITGADLAFRPGRVIVASETDFASNRYLLNHASANRDLLSNAFRWLTGLSGSGAPGRAGVIRVGQDSRAWRTDFLIATLGLPLAFCLILWLFNRRRS